MVVNNIKSIPSIFRDSYFKDVSSEYPNFIDVRAPINVPRPAGASKEYVYLAMLTVDKRWEIVARGKSAKYSIFPVTIIAKYFIGMEWQSVGKLNINNPKLKVRMEPYYV
jgi:hypothetical protein